MSRWVRSGGKLFPREFFDPPLNLPKGTCPYCGGKGEVPDSIDRDRCDAMFPCFWCRTFCKACGDWVKKSGHDCKGERDASVHGG